MVGPKFKMASENCIPSAIMRHYLCHCMFSHFDTIPECDRHTHTHKHTRRRHIGLMRLHRIAW